MKRECFIDIYRVCLMFGICLLHSITQTGRSIMFIGNMLQWCVPSFIFISGWYGIRCTVGKVLKLYGISLYCAFAFVAFDGIATFPCEEVLLRIYKIAISQWYLNAYVIVMCLAPILNLATERMSLKELLPLLLLVFAWSFATTLPICDFIPLSSGLTAYSFLTLLGVYVVGGFVRKLYDEGGRFFEVANNRKILSIVLVVGLIMAAIGLGDYNSPFAVVIAGSVFFLLKNLTIPSWIGNICVWLGPSMFSVYLIHSHGQAWVYLKVVEDYFLNHGIPLLFASILTALGVFIVCLLADLPRRIVVSLLNKVR